jgi:hypothetical protein
MPCTNQHGRCYKKIEHIIKLQALGINSKTVNNIKNLTCICLIVLAPDFMTKIGKKAAQDFFCAVSKVLIE